MRIAVADVEHVVVIRSPNLTCLFIPPVIDTARAVKESRALLTHEEIAIIRAATGATAADPDAFYAQTLPETMCFCFVPSALRAELTLHDEGCPLHSAERVDAPRPAMSGSGASTVFLGLWGLAHKVSYLDMLHPIGTHHGLRLVALLLLGALVAPRIGAAQPFG